MVLKEIGDDLEPGDYVKVTSMEEWGEMLLKCPEKCGTQAVFEVIKEDKVQLAVFALVPYEKNMDAGFWELKNKLVEELGEHGEVEDIGEQYGFDPEILKEGKGGLH